MSDKGVVDDERRAHAEAYRAHAPYLAALCYRLTGSRADAADLVQDTFTRLMTRGPADRDRDLRPWLVRVAVNLARDRYRARRRRRYVGPWLPTAVDTEASPELVGAVDSAEARYSAGESVTLAFMVALEALSPSERAVLVLRDVLDYAVAEAADALGLSEANVRTLHLRARRKLEAYDAERADRGGIEAQRDALGRLAMALATHDAAALTALLAAEVRARTDGGGVVRAALREVRGADKVTRFFLGLREKQGGAAVAAALREINGAPALVLTVEAPRPRWATRLVLSVDATADGRVRAVFLQMAPDKLAEV